LSIDPLAAVSYRGLLPADRPWRSDPLHLDVRAAKRSERVTEDRSPKDA